VAEAVGRALAWIGTSDEREIAKLRLQASAEISAAREIIKPAARIAASGVGLTPSERLSLGYAPIDLADQNHAGINRSTQPRADRPGCSQT
jgi:hypothetical protein